MKILLLLSGPSAVGKTTIATLLTEEHSFRRVSTSSYLARMASSLGQVASKANLQTLGDDLDQRTDFGWVVDAVARPSFSEHPGIERWLVDSVRKKPQIATFRAQFGNPVLHVHLTAPDLVLRERYNKRMKETGQKTSYDEAISHPNEVAARSLADISDMTFDIARLPDQDVVDAILDECHKRGSPCAE